MLFSIMKGILSLIFENTAFILFYLFLQLLVANFLFWCVFIAFVLWKLI